MRLNRLAIGIAGAVAVAATAVAIPTSASAAEILKSPERLHVTNVTATEVSFRWVQNVSGFIGQYRFRIFRNGSQVATIPLINYRASGLTPGATYTFHVVAADAVGNTSPASRTLTVTTRGPGVIPPGPTNLRTTEVAPSRVSIAFAQPDDAWDISQYEVFDGTTRVASLYASFFWGLPTIEFPLRELAPGSGHSYWARAVRPGFGNSPLSNTVGVTLPAKTDNVSPSVPTALIVKQATYACFTVNVTWAQSSDDTDSQPAIDYDVRVNGVREGWVRGAGTFQIGIIPVGTNVVTVNAVDSSGNASAVATGTYVRNPSCTDDA